MAVGVYETRKKDNSIYYRVSITYKNRHISLGSHTNKRQAATMYKLAAQIITSVQKHQINADTMHTTYNPRYALSFAKYVTLINFRDNDIYIKTPVYLCKNFFLYFLDENTVLKFSTDDLFYYSNHTIMKRGGYYFVNDYGMQTSILNRYGIRNHSVKGRDYIFRNGDPHDFRYENVCVINRYNGVSRIEKNGRQMFRSKIHINGDYIIGTYATENEAAIAYNKAADMLVDKFSISPAADSGAVAGSGAAAGVAYARNYIEGISQVEYASMYHNIKLNKKFRDYVAAL